MDEARGKHEPPHSDDPVSDVEAEDATAELVAFLDGELDPDAAEAVEAKISLDPAARADADALKRTWDLLDHLPRPEPSRTFTERTLSRIEPVAKSQTAATEAIPAKSGPVSVASATATIPCRPRYSTRRFIKVGCWLLAVLGAGLAGYFGRARYTEHFHQMDERDRKAQMSGDKHLLLNLPKYRYVETKEHLLSLDDPELFGDEP
jgi:ferric-dicitrate binding protein FerR (iron transport regulator)